MFFYAELDDYSALYDHLPDPETRTSVPVLSNVLSQVLGLTDEYSPGTLVVIPVTNELIPVSALGQSSAVSFNYFILYRIHIRIYFLFVDVSIIKIYILTKIY